MGTHLNQHLKRTNLFLVRVWTEGEGDEGEGEGIGEAAWQGMVQRVVDGETHRFDNLQSLVDTLNEMLSGGEGERL